MADLILAIDQGTTGTTVFVIDSRAHSRPRLWRDSPVLSRSRDGSSTIPRRFIARRVSLAKKALEAARARGHAMSRHIGITNQRETFVVWERKPGPPGASRDCVAMPPQRGYLPPPAPITKRRFLRAPACCSIRIFPAPSSSGCSMRNPNCASARRAASYASGPSIRWLIFKLSGGAAFVTDYTNASRTMLFNLEHHTWDEEMLRMLDVPAEMLPGAISSRGPFAEAAAGTIGNRAIPIGAVIGDQQSALFGQRAVEPGDSKSTYGTGAFLLMHTGNQRVALAQSAADDGGARTRRREPAYAFEGSVFIAGAAMQWLRDGVGLINCSREPRARAQEPQPAQRALRGAGFRRARRAVLGCGGEGRDRGYHARHHARQISCARRSIASHTRCAT